MVWGRFGEWVWEVECPQGRNEEAEEAVRRARLQETSDEGEEMRGERWLAWSLEVWKVCVGVPVCCKGCECVVRTCGERVFVVSVVQMVCCSGIFCVCVSVGLFVLA